MSNGFLPKEVIMEPEKNIHEMFEEIEKETPARNKWKKQRKGENTYQTFGMIYGLLYGTLCGFFVGILLDKTSVCMTIGLFIGAVLGRVIGSTYKKKPKKNKPAEETPKAE